MLLQFWIGILGSIMLNVALIYWLAKLFTKMEKNPAAGGTIGFFVGIIFVFYIGFGLSRCYVVTGHNEYTHYLVLGEPEYDMKEGGTIKVAIDGGECMVINDTEDDIIVEEVQYGGFSFSDNNNWIEANKAECVEGGSIDYFFDDEPPDEISVNSDSDEVIKLWLRHRRR